jgi:hypothetical protein
LLKKLLGFFLIFCSIFFLIALGKHAIGFIKSNTLNIASENIANIPIKAEAKGFPIFAGVPIYSQSVGMVEFNVQPGNFVEKGDILGLLASGDKQILIISPSSGIFLNYKFAIYESKIGTNLLDPNSVPSPIKERAYVKANEIIGSIITDSNFYICLKGINISDSKKYLTFLLSDKAQGIDGKIVKIDRDYAFVLLKDFMNYFLDKREFTVVKDVVKGIIVDNENIVEKNGEKGLLIINGNKISFFKVNFIPFDNARSVALINGYDSLLVVKNAHFVGENEIIGGF